MSQVALDDTDEDPDRAETGRASDPQTASQTVRLVALAPDRSTERAWTFTGAEGSFPSWAWR